MTDFIATQLDVGATHVHRCDARALAELLDQIGKECRCLPCILTALNAWRASPTPEDLEAVGGNRFPLRFQLVP